MCTGIPFHLQRSIPHFSGQLAVAVEADLAFLLILPEQRILHGKTLGEQGAAPAQ